jgi:general nucleoside transport system ATP-binding protein
MVGREVAAPVKGSCPQGNAVALRVEGLRLHPGAEPVAFTIRKGEILGVAGVAGNGQGELAAAITGLDHVRGAVIELNGRDLSGLGAARFRTEGIAHIPEDRNRMGVVPAMSVEDNFALRWLDFREFHRGPLILRRRIHEQALKLIGRYRVSTPSLQTRVSLLSGGNVQRVILAREFAEDPELIVAVHPTYGLDVQAIAQVHQALLDQAAKGTAILLISEDLDELLALADRIAVLYRKRIIGVVDRASVRVEQLGLLMLGHAA